MCDGIVAHRVLLVICVGLLASARVAPGVGWRFETARLHWRLRAGLPLGLSATAASGEF